MYIQISPLDVLTPAQESGNALNSAVFLNKVPIVEANPDAFIELDLYEAFTYLYQLPEAHKMSKMFLLNLHKQKQELKNDKTTN